MLPFILILLIIVLCFGLARASAILVTGINRLSLGTKVTGYSIAVLVVAMATGLPELLLGVFSGINGTGELLLGVAIGSSIVNISLVVGLTALVAGSVKASDLVVKKDILQSFLLAVIPLLLLLDKQLSRFDGLILVVVYTLFAALNLPSRKKNQTLHAKVVDLIEDKTTNQGLWELMLGTAGLIVCADLIVFLTKLLALEIQLPLIWLGLFIIALGTSIPELAFGLRTALRKQHQMTFGNIIGSVVVNATLVLGISALIRPIELQSSAKIYYISVISFILMYAVFWALTKSKKRLDRWEGVLLIALYLVFFLVQMWADCGTAFATCLPRLSGA